MELNSGELPEPPDDDANDLSEAELQRLIELWRKKGDREAANRVWRYIVETYYQWVLNRVSARLRIGLPAREANKDDEDRDEDQQDLDELDMGKDDDGEASEPVAVGHRTQGPCDAKVCNGAASSSGDANNQHHDYVMAGGQQVIEELDLSLYRGVWVTKNRLSSTDGETYTGNYSERNKLRSREDFEWKGKAAFGKLIKMMWVNRTIDSLKDMIDSQSTAGPRLIEGDLPDPQGFQEAVSSGIRSIDQFMRRELDVACKGKEWLSETAIRAVLNRLIDGEPLWHKPEIGCVVFGKEFKGFKPKTKISQQRANRAVLVDQYPGWIISVEERVPGTKKWVLPVQAPGHSRLILDLKERSAGTKRKPPVQIQKSIEEDTLAARADATAGDRRVQPRDQLTVREAQACVFTSRELLHEIFRLSELTETLPEGSTDRRLLEGLIIFRKYMLWNICSARSPLVWTSGTPVTDEEQTLFEEISRTSIEQLVKEADFSIFLDDLREGGQPLYEQATKFILRYCMLDLPRDVSKADMEKRANSFVHQPKTRLRPKLEPIVGWFYRDKKIRKMGR